MSQPQATVAGRAALRWRRSCEGATSPLMALLVYVLGRLSTDLLPRLLDLLEPSGLVDARHQTAKHGLRIAENTRPPLELSFGSSNPACPRKRWFEAGCRPGSAVIGEIRSLVVYDPNQLIPGTARE